MKGILFKQWYKPMNLKGTAVLNRKHLIYIATRPGSIHNYGAGYGLFGKIPGMEAQGVVEDFERAKKIVTAVSHRRTIYRATLSLDDRTAKEKGYYNRAEWEKLAYKNMKAIAKEMNISPRSMCWVASYHHARGHPHIHIMYWDNSTKIREEFVPPERFQIMSENVKAAFNRDIYHNELQDLRTQLTDEEKLLRTELRAMCRESNVADILNLQNVSQLKLDQIGEQLHQLILGIPAYGRLAYAYLPEDYKAQVDTCVESIMQITDFKREEQRVCDLSDRISEYYGNGLEKIKYNRDKASSKLRTSLGNELMSFIREYQRDLGARVPTDIRGQAEELKRLCRNIIHGNAEIAAAYGAAVESFPKERTPRSVLMSEEARRALYEKLRGDIQADMRVRTQIRACAARWTSFLENAQTEDPRHVAYSKACKIYDHVLYQMLYEDAGYQHQEDADMALTAMFSLFQIASQSSQQQRNQLQLDRHRRSAELSETARKDMRKKQEQEGGWSL